MLLLLGLTRVRVQAGAIASCYASTTHRARRWYAASISTYVLCGPADGAAISTCVLGGPPLTTTLSAYTDTRWPSTLRPSARCAGWTSARCVHQHGHAGWTTANGMPSAYTDVSYRTTWHGGWRPAAAITLAFTLSLAAAATLCQAGYHYVHQRYVLCGRVTTGSSLRWRLLPAGRWGCAPHLHCTSVHS
jgi:ribosome modulation factor